MSFFGKLIPKGIKRRLKKSMGVYDEIHIERISADIANRKYAKIIDEGVSVEKFKDKVVVVTGATGFIGKTIVKRLADKGAITYLCARNAEKAQGVIDELSTDKTQIKPLLFDISNADEIKDAFEKVLANEGRIDILVNCAGGSARDEWSYLYDQKVEIIDNLLDINLRGTIICSKYASKAMVEQKSGRIINVSSTVGVGGKSGFTDYAATKAGVIGFTRSLAIELGAYGITVNCVTPGIVQRGGITNEKLKEITAKNVMHSIGIADDISYAIEFFASDEAGFITGQNLIADGGRSLGLKGD